MKFSVLYTHQKTKKSKSWKDGFLIAEPDSKTAVLQDEEGGKIGSVKLKGDVNVGDDLETATFLIQIDALSAYECNNPKVNSAPAAPHSYKNARLFKKPTKANVSEQLCRTSSFGSVNIGMEFSVLYTHQKVKKCKMWQDGFLDISSNGRTGLLMNENRNRIDEMTLRSSVNVGDELESSKYLIQVESNPSNEKACHPTSNDHEQRESPKSPATVENIQPKKRKFMVPRHTGPPTASTHEFGSTTAENEFDGIECTVVRQGINGIWGMVHYNQKSLPVTPQPASPSTSDIAPLEPKKYSNGYDTISSRKDILDIIKKRKVLRGNEFAGEKENICSE